MSLKEKFCNFNKKFRILENHTVLSVLLTLAAVGASCLLTGAIFSRNEVVIHDGEETFRVFTMYDEASEILSDYGIELGEYDRVDFSGIKDGEGELTVKRGVTVTVISKNGIVSVQCAVDETAAQAVKRAGIEIKENDVICPSHLALCGDTEEITVYEGYPVYIAVDGHRRKYYTTEASTAADLLKSAGIELGENDELSCKAEDTVPENAVVKVTRVRYEVERSEDVIPFETVTNTDNLKPMSYRETVREGENGLAENVKRVRYENGRIAGEEIISSVTIKAPVDEIVNEGAALAAPYSQKDPEDLVLENGIPVNYSKVLTGRSAAYTARQGSGTASGRKLEIGTVAVDPAIIPYGSELYIVSTDGSYVYGYAIAADTGFLTENNFLVDLYMGNMEDNYMTSVRYGVKQVNVYILN